jgi:hypothetical protein
VNVKAIAMSYSKENKIKQTLTFFMFVVGGEWCHTKTAIISNEAGSQTKRIFHPSSSGAGFGCPFGWESGGRRIGGSVREIK